MLKTSIGSILNVRSSCSPRTHYDSRWGFLFHQSDDAVGKAVDSEVRDLRLGSGAGSVVPRPVGSGAEGGVKPTFWQVIEPVTPSAKIARYV